MYSNVELYRSSATRGTTAGASSTPGPRGPGTVVILYYLTVIAIIYSYSISITTTAIYSLQLLLYTCNSTISRPWNCLNVSAACIQGYY